ncbi:hypothetical protein BS78_01G104600 [Paspalum vaginatum]|nr:hypothetical protein BS78_01G104600 [Paspalum vaginatum]
MMMKLARPVCATTTTLLLLVVACLLFQVSDCARRQSSPRGEAWWKATALRMPAVHGRRDDARRQLPTEVVGGVSAGRTPPPPDATQVLRGKDDEGVGSAPPQQRTLLALFFLRSRSLPRRFLVRTDAAKASCPSHDVHIGCPPSKR